MILYAYSFFLTISGLYSWNCLSCSSLSLTEQLRWLFVGLLPPEHPFPFLLLLNCWIIFLTRLRLSLLSIQFTSESRSVSFFLPHPMPEPCCGFSLLLIRQQQARRPLLCDGCRRGAGPAGKGDTPCVRSAIVVVAMVVIVVVAREMAVACLTRLPRAVTGIIDARCCSALWECGREGGEDNG